MPSISKRLLAVGRVITFLGVVLFLISCERGIEEGALPPSVAPLTETVAASAIPNVTSSIFQNQSFECLNEVYNTAQNVKQSVPFQKDFSDCRFLAVVVEEFLNNARTGKGHVFSREALENPASDTFGEYRNEVINPNTAANSDLSTSQRAQQDLAARCTVDEEVRVKRIEPTPGALRIVPPGCKDAAGNQLEYAFSLVFCCPKKISQVFSNTTRDDLSHVEIMFLDSNGKIISFSGAGLSHPAIQRQETSRIVDGAANTVGFVTVVSRAPDGSKRVLFQFEGGLPPGTVKIEFIIHTVPTATGPATSFIDKVVSIPSP